jgi:hypothetical protein
MTIETQNTSAIFLALLLLYICVLGFLAACEYRWAKNLLKAVLWVFGVIPGFLGSCWGVWIYWESHKTLLILPAFLLLEIGAGMLLRVWGKRNET